MYRAPPAPRHHPGPRKTWLPVPVEINSVTVPSEIATPPTARLLLFITDLHHVYLWPPPGKQRPPSSCPPTPTAPAPSHREEK